MTKDDDPATWRQHNFAESGATVYAVQNGSQFVYIYSGEPPYRIREFRLATDRELHVGGPLSQLLATRHQIVPFEGRSEELGRLSVWRDSTEHLSVHLVEAAGGEGKSRLAAQFATTSADLAWTVAEVRHRNDPTSAAIGDQHVDVSDRGLILVVDYAERWPVDHLIGLLTQHQTATIDRPIRVLLLARSRAGWWSLLAHQLVKLGITSIESVHLPTLAQTPDEQLHLYQAAWTAFAAALDLQLTAPPIPNDLPGGGVLALHMRALVDLDASLSGRECDAGSDGIGVSAYLLAREKEYWDVASKEAGGPLRTRPLAMASTVYTATLIGGCVSHELGVVAVTRARIAEVSTEPAAQVLSDHSVIYPPSEAGAVLEPLRPDRLGEDFVALVTPGAATLSPEETLPSLTAVAEQLVNGDEEHTPWEGSVVTVLVEAASRWQHVAVSTLYPLLLRRPSLALTAGGSVLARLAEQDHEGIVGVLEGIERELPRSRDTSLDAGIAVLAQRVTERRLGETEDPAERANLYFELAFRLGNAGSLEEALAAIHEAVAMYEGLTSSRGAHDRDLAVALDRLGAYEGELGDWAAAVAAGRKSVAVHRRLVLAEGPDCEAELAGALDNLSLWIAATGTPQEALGFSQEAVSTYRRVIDRDPARIVGMAGALANLGIHFAEAGERAKGLSATEEAVGLYEKLASISPGEFRPKLAAALHNLDADLSAVGRSHEGMRHIQRATEVRRALANELPTAFEPDLVASLLSLSRKFSELEAPERALGTSSEAVEICRRLVQRHQARFEPELGKSLISLGADLMRLDRFDDAHGVLSEARGVLERYADIYPAHYRRYLALCLVNLAGTLWVLDDRHGAVRTAADAADLYEALAAGNSYFEGNVISTLEMGRSMLREIHEVHRARETTKRIIASYRRLLAVTRTKFEPLLAVEVSQYATELATGGHVREAVDSFDEAVTLYRQIAARDPDEEPNLARALTNLGSALWSTGAMGDAIALASEAVEIYDRLDPLPPAFASDAQWAVALLSEMLSNSAR